MSFWETLLSDFFGNPAFMSFFLIVGVISLVFFIRSSKFVIEGIALIIAYGLMDASLIPSWVFFIVLVIIGLDVGKLLIGSFLSS